MKKIISAIAALTACAVMLTACGGGDTSTELQDEITTTAAEEVTTSEEADDNSNEGSETEKADSSNEDDNDSDSADIDNGDDDEIKDDDTDKGSSEPASVVFASLSEFAESDLYDLPYEKTAAADSNTYDFIKTLEGADGLYLDIESTDKSVAMTMAFDAKNNIAMDVTDDTGTRVIIIITNMTMYMLEPTSMSGFYYAVDESVFDDYNMEEMLGQINIDEASLSDSEDIDSCTVEIGGTKYVFEFSNGSGFLYKTDGTLCAILTNDNSLEITTLIVNEFSKNVPANAFDIPSGYELVDLEAALGGLE